MDPTTQGRNENTEEDVAADMNACDEFAPPALTPRPQTAPEDPQGASMSPAFLNVSKAINRPQWLSKATTAVSRTDIHQQGSPKTPPHRSRAASVTRSFSTAGRFAGLAASDVEDNASVRSFRSYAPDYSGDVASLLGDGLSVQSETSPGKDAGTHFQDSDPFAMVEEGDLRLKMFYEHEFDELEALEPDGSNEESLIIRWRSKLKHFLILSSAGKPIYSRHGDDQLISNSIGIVQTVISSFIGADDALTGFTAGDARFVVLSKGHLHLLAISRMGENDAQLRAQLEAMYMQILSTLTLPHMQRMFINRPSTDLRRPLEGTEILLSALADDFTSGSPSTLLSALECLRLGKSQREAINHTMVKCRTENLLYGLIVAGGRLVSVIRPKKQSLHPGDLHLIFNMLFKSGGVRAGGGENWIPLCLPGFNNTGYLHMYVNFLSSTDGGADRASTSSTEEDAIAILLISANKESFYELRGMHDELVEQLEANGSMSIIRSAIKNGRFSCTDVVPGTVVRHFLYKSRANVQFTMPTSTPDFDSHFKWRKLMSLYCSLHASVHNRTSHLKVHHSSNENYISLAWLTPLFEMYCVASATVGRTALAQGAGKLEQWARREEETLFIVGGAVF